MSTQTLIHRKAADHKPRVPADTNAAPDIYEKMLCRLAIGMATLVVLVLFWPALSGKVYIKDDLASFHLPARALYADSLARGDSPIWTSKLLSGYYLHGEGQVGMLHPLHLVLYRVFPLALAFNLELSLTYVFLLAGTFFFLRTWRIKPASAMFGSLVFSFSGFALLHFVHPNMVAVAAHMPWILIAIEKILVSDDPRIVARAEFGLGLLTVSQILLGHPQAVWLSVVAEVLYTAFRIPACPFKTRLLGLAQAKVLGVLGGCIQLLPTWDVVLNSRRAAPTVEFSYLFSLEPANLLQLVSPYLTQTRVFGSRFTQEFGLYCGAVSSVLLVWLLIRGRNTSHRRLALASIGMTVLGLVLALGKYGYLYRLQAHLPLIGQFESPARYILLMHFGVAVAAAVSFADILESVRNRQRYSWRQICPLALLPLASIVVSGIALLLPNRSDIFRQLGAQLAPTSQVLLGPALIIAATLLVVAALRGMPVALVGIILFSVVDEGFYGVSFIRAPVPPIEAARFAEGQAKPPEPAPYRVQSNNNILAMQGVSLSGGYVAFGPQRQLDPFDPQRLRLSGVRWVETLAPWGKVDYTGTAKSPNLDRLLARPVNFTYDGAGGRASWVEISDPLPRARLVSHEVITADFSALVDSIDVESTVLLAHPVGLEEGRSGTAKILRDESGSISVAASSPSTQLLVVSESWHPGWRARLDGRPSSVIQAYGDFIGCVVPAGDHRVDFDFQPRSFRAGAYLSALGLTLMIASCYVKSKPVAPGARTKTI